MSSSFLPQLFRRDEPEEEEQSADFSYTFEGTQSGRSTILEYSDTEDDGPAERERERKRTNLSSFRVYDTSLGQSAQTVAFAGSSDEDDSQRHHHRSTITTTNWMQQLAHSFRPEDQQLNPQHKRVHSNSMREYPHHSSSSSFNNNSTEQSPLLASSKPPTTTETPASKHKQLFHVAVAASFLQDYEANRPPSLSMNLADINSYQLHLHQIKFSGWFFPMNICLATLALFLSSGLEGDQMTLSKRLWLTGLNLYAFIIFAVDLWIRTELRPRSGPSRRLHTTDPRQRVSRSGKLVKPLILFGLVLLVETLSRLVVAYMTNDPQPMVLFSSLFKPLILFYVSFQARDALEALRRILRIVLRVLIMELLLILMFAAIAVRLFTKFDTFHNLSTSWLSLFELATTVVNPSIWMPMYHENKYSALFFIFFIVTAVFYLHSLVLSVVFQTYVHAASEIHERRVADREDAVHLAYLALRQQDPSRTVIPTSLVRQMLCAIRPHYNAHKINALVEIVDPSNQKVVDYPTFRAKIRQALNASIRTARTASTAAMSVELLAVVVAIINFVYVILVSSSFDEEWFNNIQELLGCGITAVAALELLIRFNPLRIADFTPLTRLNATFDGLALVGALVSSIGILLYASDSPMALELILMGRAIDIFRVMRFFKMFRDVVRRSSDVLPVLTGPIVLVITTMHIFVYVGMALWSGAVEIGTYADHGVPLYELNNFNSYQEGIVTMFQVLVVNDWHAIAEVFLYANRCSSPFIVFAFFVTGNLIGVSIMLNVLTAFFVQSFVTKLEDETVTPAENPHKVHQKPSADFSIKTSENSGVRRISSTASIHEHGSDRDRGADADSEGSSDDDFLEFDVYEREGFDKIMQAVAGNSFHQGNMARDICDYLEIFEKLAADREPVGYLICDQLTMERFGNLRFQTRAEGFLELNELHVIVSDMHAELLALSARLNRDRSLIRTYPHRQNNNETLEITAALLRRHPALSLFVSRRRKKVV